MDTPDDNPTEPTQPQPPPGAPEPGPRRLTRAGDDRVFAGVCGGLGRYFGVDAVLFRIGAIALVALGGAGVLLYLAAWLLIPTDGAVAAGEDGRRRGLAAIGAALLVIGAAAALSGGPLHSWPWPVGLILLAGLGVWAASAAGGLAPNESARRAGRVMLVLLACAILAVGGAWLAGVGGATAAGIAIVVVGAAIVAAGLAGWGARWLIAPALALALPAAAVAATGVDLHGGVGDRTERPTSPAQVKGEYRLGAGRLVVDLRAARLPAGDRPLRVRLGAGEAVVLVPADMCVATHATIGAGQADNFDRGSGGLDVDWSDEPSAPARHPRLLLDADLGVGHLAVAHRLADVDAGRWDHGHDHGGVAGERNTGCEASRVP